MKDESPMIAVYTGSIKTAEQRSDLEIWLYSRMENLRCKEALEHLLQEKPETLSLDAEQGQSLLQEFGIDRLMWVTAFALHEAPGMAGILAWVWADSVIPQGYPMDEGKEWTITAGAEYLVPFAEQLGKLYESFGLIGEQYTTEPMDQSDVTGKLLIVDPRVLADDVKIPHFQLFYAQDGGENKQFIQGISLADGQSFMMRRSSFLGIGNEAMLPNWAAERLEQARTGQLQEIPQAEKYEEIEVIAS